MTFHRANGDGLKKPIGQSSKETIYHTDNRSSPELSVIIVSWNAKKYLQECLHSLSSNITRTHEIIVVDNASTDGSPEMVIHDFPRVKLVQTGRNLGFAKANNIGILQSQGNYIALINSDVNVFPGCLDHLANFLDTNPVAGMVGPRIMNGDRSQQPSCRLFPNLWNTFCGMLNLYKIFPSSRLFSSEQMSYFSYDRITEVEILSGCFILARRTAVSEFGLLDEDFWMYGEDVDWSRRCKIAGWKLFFTPDGEAIHYGGGSSANNPVRFEIAQQQARLQLWRKHYGAFSLFIFIILLFCHRLIRVISTWVYMLIWRNATDDVKKIFDVHYSCLSAIPSNLRFLRTRTIK